MSSAFTPGLPYQLMRGIDRHAWRPCSVRGGSIRKTLAAAGLVASLFIYLYVNCISLICGKNRITLKYKALRRVAQRHPKGAHKAEDAAGCAQNGPRQQVDQPQHDFNRAILPSIAAQLAIGLKKFYR
ncbi:hypothetical protein [Herbaspirillum sp. VT-16-41]|uniref:hypothetical protein n=1 Tax=Herbaspirillum sp. VT-16-41 TaxID=1953765 RepID=UPI0011154A36|nr:hypothetical protein [Herbaspirillum sp. VT-16-41]